MHCKKFLFFFVCLVAIFVLVGCNRNSSKEDREILFNEMEKQDIISKGYKEVDTVEHCAWGLESCKCTKYYIYKDDSSNLIAISYESGKYSSGGYDHIITVFSNVVKYDSGFETVDNLDCEYGYYKYKNGDKTLQNNYGFNYPSTTYRVKVDGKKYIFE